MLIEIIIATVFVSLVSLVGLLILLRIQAVYQITKPLISLAAGALITVSLLDLLPEAIEGSAGVFEPHLVFGVALASFLVFFVMEKIFHWHHCRCATDEHARLRSKKHFVYLNLTGDAIHNIIDGFLIASAFLVSTKTGILVTGAVILHEIPQEISDFGILIYGGLSKLKALMYNLFIAGLAIAGAVTFFFFGQSFQQFIPLMAAFAAGNFIYLAAADLIPELHEEENETKVILHTLWLLAGVAIMVVALLLIPHGV